MTSFSELLKRLDPIEHKAGERRRQAAKLRELADDADEQADAAEGDARRSLDPADAEKPADLRARAVALRKALPSEGEITTAEMAVLYGSEALQILREMHTLAAGYVPILRERAAVAAERAARAAVEESPDVHGTKAKAAEALGRYRNYRDEAHDWHLRSIPAGQATYGEAKAHYVRLLNAIPADIKTA